MVAVMRIILLAAALAFAGAAGCAKKSDSKSEQAASKVPTVTVDEVDKQLAAGDCVPVDANGEQTRKKMGVVPGAVLLSDSEKFNVSELPADKSKTLVFYCANNHCGASHEAAGRALTAGYTSVKVMPEGIAGWVSSGKKVQNI
jgi:rhodanese-related sulfurtransferase